jgi:hypothetical protein
MKEEEEEEGEEERIYNSRTHTRPLSWHSRESREGFLAGRAGRERFFIGRISPKISKKSQNITPIPIC